MLQWFIRFSEFTESSAPFRENLNKSPCYFYYLNRYDFIVNCSIVIFVQTPCHIILSNQFLFPFQTHLCPYSTNIELLEKICNVNRRDTIFKRYSSTEHTSFSPSPPFRDVEIAAFCYDLKSFVLSVHKLTLRGNLLHLPVIHRATQWWSSQADFAPIH